jgi:hypothetical protein
MAGKTDAELREARSAVVTLVRCAVICASAVVGLLALGDGCNHPACTGSVDGACSDGHCFATWPSNPDDICKKYDNRARYATSGECRLIYVQGVDTSQTYGYDSETGELKMVAATNQHSQRGGCSGTACSGPAQWTQCQTETMATGGFGGAGATSGGGASAGTTSESAGGLGGAMGVGGAP